MKRSLIAAGVALALLLAVLSPLASTSPDGLERVAEDHGFLQLAKEPLFDLLPDYTIPGVSSEAASTIIAGVVGTLVVFGATYGLGRLVKRLGAADTH